MKNLVISVLSAILLTGMDFWTFDKPSDRPIITVAAAIIIFVAIVALEEWIRERRIKKFRSERFWRMINEQQNRP